MSWVTKPQAGYSIPTIRHGVEEALRWSEKPGHHLLCLADPEYPQALLQIPDPPTLLYVRGRLDLLNTPALAMVGSRNPTPQGIHRTPSASLLPALPMPA
jgi:DNA processing protein